MFICKQYLLVYKGMLFVLFPIIIFFMPSTLICVSNSVEVQNAVKKMLDNAGSVAKMSSSVLKSHKKAEDAVNAIARSLNKVKDVLGIKSGHIQSSTFSDILPDKQSILLTSAWKASCLEKFQINYSFIKNIIDAAETLEEIEDFAKSFVAQESWLKELLNQATVIGDAAYTSIMLKSKTVEALVAAQKKGDYFLQKSTADKNISITLINRMRLTLLYDLYAVIEEINAKNSSKIQELVLADSQIELMVKKIIEQFVSAQNQSKSVVQNMQLATTAQSVVDGKPAIMVVGNAFDDGIVSTAHVQEFKNKE